MNIHTVFAHRPAFRTVVQLKAPLEITAPTSQLVRLAHVGVGFAPPAQAGGSRPFLFIEVTAAQVLAKQIVLPSAPQTEVLLDVVGGTLQKQNVDFVVTGNLLSWTGLSLELLLEAGNYLTISYT